METKEQNLGTGAKMATEKPVPKPAVEQVVPTPRPLYTPLNEIVKKMDLVDTSGRIPQRIRSFGELADMAGSVDMISKAQQEGKISQNEMIKLLGVLAYENMPPEGYIGAPGKIPKKEPLPWKIWRRAVNELRAWEVKPTNTYKYSQKSWQERIQTADRAHAWLRSFVPQEHLEDSPYADSKARVEQHLASVTNFEVLPPKHNEDGSDRSIRERLGVLGELFESGKLDEERIKFLLKYADDHGGSLYVSRFGLKSQGDKVVIEIPLDKAESGGDKFGFNYLIVVFDKNGGPDGLLRKFAVADNVYRGAVKQTEQGVEKVAVGAIYAFEERPDNPLTWQEVFSKTKDEAKKLGLKITHRGDFPQRLENFLN